MTFSLRPFAADFAAILPLVNLLNPGPATPEQLEAMHARFPAGGLRHRLVAVDEQGRVIGYGNAAGGPAVAPPGEFYLTLVTAPGARRQGVGSALLEALESWARANGGIRMRTSSLDDAEPYRFAQHHGYVATGHQLTSHLQVAAFDESPFAGVVERVEQSGIRFFPYTDRPGEETKRLIYELYKITDLDTPGYAGTNPDDYPPYEQWHAELFGNENTLPESLLIAAHGDRFVGMTVMQKEGTQGGLYTEYTGVLREYRNRGIGLALKLLSVRFARAYGAPYMSTRNDATNGSMLAVNRKMGYEKVSGRYWLTREL